MQSTQESLHESAKESLHENAKESLHETSLFISRFGGNCYSLLAAFMYGSCSIIIAFLNKLLLTTYEFNFPVFIMASQMLFTIAALEILKMAGIIKMPRYTLERGKSFAVPALFYAINSILALSALSYMNLALYGVLKRCVPVVTMILSVYILEKGCPSKLTILSVIFLTLGCVLAGYGDLTFNVLGYICGALSNVAQSVYLLLVQKVTNGKMSVVESLQLNSMNTFLFLIIFCVVNGELGQMRKYSHYNDVSFIMLFFISISLGCFLNYTLFLCTSLTSALTTSVVGGIKAIVQTVIGFFTFGGVSHNWSTYIGISVSVGGGLSYIYAKYRENVQRNFSIMLKDMSFSTAEDLNMQSEEKERTHNGIIAVNIHVNPV